MKKSNIWQNVLTVLAVVVVAVIGGALANLSQMDAAQYLPDNTPENIAFDYQLAIIRHDYTRAYSYISPSLPGYPANLDKFKADLLANEGTKIDAPRCVYIDTVNNDPAQAQITLIEQWDTSGACPKVKPPKPVNQNYNPIYVVLEPESGTWKITVSNGHFPVCWATPGGCQ